MTRKPLLKLKKRNAQPEAQLQRAIVQVVRLMCVPDLVWGASTQGMAMAPRTAAHMKAMGMEPGFPDLCFLVKGMFYGLEVKANGGKQSLHQKDFECRVFAQGGTYVIANNIDTAIDYLVSWGAIREYRRK
jgi:hypothetical protein